MVSFRDMLYPAITLKRFQALREDPEAKRICFGSIHKNALKPGNGGRAAGWFNVPFAETISSVFPWPLSRNTKGKFGGYYHAVSDEQEFSEIRQWLTLNADVVFLRSLFTTAVAACEHYISTDARSKVGELEHSAKYEGNNDAREKLIGVLHDVFQRMHRARKIDGIASIPPSKSGSVSLPNALASALSVRLGMPDLTPYLKWDNEKPPIKELSVDEKWAALEAVGMSVGTEFAGKNILLIDDMYQSGSTAHFVGSKLRESGVNDIHMLAVSKGRRDTDNKK